MHAIYVFLFTLCNGAALDTPLYTRRYVAVPHELNKDTSVIKKIGPVELGEYKVGFYQADDDLWYYGPYYWSNDDGVVVHGAVSPEMWVTPFLNPTSWDPKNGIAINVSEADTAKAHDIFSNSAWVPTPDCLNQMSLVCERTAGASGNSVAQLEPGTVQLTGNIITGGVKTVGGAEDALRGFSNAVIQAGPPLLNGIAQGGRDFCYVVGSTLHGISSLGSTCCKGFGDCMDGGGCINVSGGGGGCMDGGDCMNGGGYDAGGYDGGGFEGVDCSDCF